MHGRKLFAIFFIIRLRLQCAPLEIPLVCLNIPYIVLLALKYCSLSSFVIACLHLYAMCNTPFTDEITYGLSSRLHDT